MITGAQIRMARGFTRLSARALAEEAGVAESTVKRMEASDGVPSASGANIEKVQKALEAAGVQFLDNGDVSAGPGVAIKSGPD